MTLGILELNSKIQKMSKFIAWFSSRNGRIFTNTCVGTAAFSTFGLHLLIHGPYQDKMKELCQIYQHGKPKPLSENVENLTKQVLQDCTLDTDQKNKIKFFNVVGQELFHFGGTNSPWGATIGVPFYFEKAENINFHEIQIIGRDFIDWIIDGHDFINSLTMSDNAKKFGIMREIYSSNIWDEVDNAAVFPFCILIPATAARRLNIKLDLFNKMKLKSRVSIYTVGIALGIFLYRLVKDPLRHISNRKYDEKAASLSQDYLEGGIEFYEHILMRNKALRELLGKAGERQFDQNGNENYFLFAPKLPISKRLEYLKKLKEKQDQET